MGAGELVSENLAAFLTGGQLRECRRALVEPAPRGAGWQRGHVNDERFMNESRTTGVPHRGHGRPFWPYTASDRSK